MIMEKQNLVGIYLTEEEVDALKIVNDLMKSVQPEDGQYLMSHITGECVDAEEFSRMRGILDFFNGGMFGGIQPGVQIYSIEDKRRY